MHITFGRKSRLTALGAGLITAAAVAVSASGPALADTADTGGTAAISTPRAIVVGLAKSTIIMLPGNPASSSYAKGADIVTLPVTGGNGEVGNFFGTVNFGGRLIIINSKAGKTVTITSLKLNFFTGALTGVFPGGTTQTALAYTGGNMSASSDPGPPATETFSCDELHLSGKAAKALNTDLNTTVFIRGTNIGAFTTTFDVTVS
jgi:hypothetical protein